MKRFLVVVALASLALPALGRIRVVRHPAEPCSFSLLPTWGSAPVSAAGQTRGIVFIYGQSATCAQWTAYSPVEWIVVEAAPLDAQPAAYVTVAPNPGQEARTATLILAGIRLEIAQEAAPAIANPGLVANGSFDTNIDGWIWYDGRFPNGRGTASWSPLDANGSPASGSISMRDDGSGLAFQRLQCLPVEKNASYRFGTKVRTNLPKERGYAAIAFFIYPSTDCSGEFTDGWTKYLSPDEPNVWQAYEFTERTGSRTKSVVLVIASAAELPPFETLFDDVFVMPAE